MTTTLPVQEHKLVTWAREQVARRLEDAPAIREALVSAEAVRGIVITTDGDNARAEDHAAALVRGQKAAEAVKRPLLDILNAIRRAIGDRLQPVTSPIDAALQEINAAQSSYTRRQREAAAEQQRARELEVQEAARLERERVAAAAESARQMALKTGASPEVAEALASTVVEEAEENVPLEDAPAVIPTATVRGSSTQSVAARTLKAEIANLADVDVVLVELRVKDACDVARRDMRREEMLEPGVGKENARVHKGVRYWYEESRSRRAT